MFSTLVSAIDHRRWHSPTIPSENMAGDHIQGSPHVAFSLNSSPAPLRLKQETKHFASFVVKNRTMF